MSVQKSDQKQPRILTEADSASDSKPSKPAPFSDIDLNQWHNYPDIITDSLWLLGARDRSSVHSAEYWGNFVPQIPHQAIRRFTKKGETVLDGFLGEGECAEGSTALYPIISSASSSLTTLYSTRRIPRSLKAAATAYC